MEQLYQKTNTLRVLAFFFENPYSENYLRQIARKTCISPSSLSRVLETLHKLGLVSKRVEKNASFFKANLSAQFKEQKIAYTVSKIAKTKVIEEIQSHSQGLSAILLYGSAAKGEDDENSDYDFLVVCSSCNVSAESLSQKLGRDVSLKKFSITKWKNESRRNRAFYLDVIANSVALFGEKPVID
ncbi:MAG: nucleotidyltransferase domain-containing protein [Candidatus Micrarchaeia archaeon]